MVGVVLVVLIFRRWIPGGSILAFADKAVLPLGIAILIGRFGCTFQGCCLGEPSGLPWALPARLEFQTDTVMLHPLALYLGVLGLGSAILSEALCRRTAVLGSIAGSRVLLFAFTFTLGRGLLESLRLQAELALAGGSWARLESFAVAGVAAVALLLRLRRAHPGRQGDLRKQPVGAVGQQRKESSQLGGPMNRPGFPGDCGS
jgi:prolipoprotein diacylglyceryltransferase